MPQQDLIYESIASFFMHEVPAEGCKHNMQATHGCGDLVFSSHTIFALSGMMTYNEYGTHLATKVCHRACVSYLCCTLPCGLLAMLGWPSVLSLSAVWSLGMYV